VRTERGREDVMRRGKRVPLLSPRRSRRPDSRTVAAANGITVLSQANTISHKPNSAESSSAEMQKKKLA